MEGGCTKTLPAAKHKHSLWNNNTEQMSKRKFRLDFRSSGLTMTSPTVGDPLQEVQWSLTYRYSVVNALVSVLQGTVLWGQAAGHK